MKHEIYEKALLSEGGKTGMLHAHENIRDRAVYFYLNQVRDRAMAYNAFVKTETINAIIRTASEKVEGNILFESEFLAVNKQHIILIGII